MKKLVIIPTYNEKENIEKIISAVFALKQDFHILVVDDSSPDGTAEIVKSLREKFPLQLHLTVRKIKDGLGKAYIHGFQWAIHNEYDYIFEMDADFSHNPKDLIKLFEACKTADMAVGSRYSQGVNVVNWPMGRVLLSYFASKYVRFVLGIPVHDTTAGFVCFKKETLISIGLDKIRLKGLRFPGRNEIPRFQEKSENCRSSNYFYRQNRRREQNEWRNHPRSHLRRFEFEMEKPDWKIVI